MERRPQRSTNNRSNSRSGSGKKSYSSRDSSKDYSKDYSKGSSRDRSPSRGSPRSSSRGSPSRGSPKGSSREFSKGPSHGSSQGFSKGFSKGPSRGSSSDRPSRYSDKKPLGSRGFSDSRSPRYGDKKPFSSRSTDRGPSRSSFNRSSFDRSSSDRSPPRDRSPRYSDKKPLGSRGFSDSRSPRYGDKKPFSSRSTDRGPSRSSFNRSSFDRSSSDRSPPRDRSPRYSDSKPFSPRSSPRDRPERKPARASERPYAKKEQKPSPAEEHPQVALTKMNRMLKKESAKFKRQNQAVSTVGIEESALKGVYHKVKKGRKSIYTINAVEGKKVYDEALILQDGVEFREWNPKKSKLAAGIIKGISQMGIKPASSVLYLGSSTGTTCSHLSDLLGPKGKLYALDFAPRVMRDFIFIAEERNNIAPIFANANKPEEYEEVGIVDAVFQDVAQPNQVEIFLKNCDKFLKSGGFGLLALKARSINVIKRPREIFAEVRDELSKHVTIVDYKELDPYEKDHALFVVKKR